jgi:hypothetical protein
MMPFYEEYVVVKRKVSAIQDLLAALRGAGFLFR